MKVDFKTEVRDAEPPAKYAPAPKPAALRRKVVLCSSTLLQPAHLQTQRAQRQSDGDERQDRRTPSQV